MSTLSKLFGRLGSRAHTKSNAPSRPADLLAKAGFADEPAFEQLEQRQLMFTLTVGPSADPNIVFTPDPNNPNRGTVTTNFAYLTPFIQRPVPDPLTAPTPEVEDMPPVTAPTTPPNGPVGNTFNGRTVFSTSGLTVFTTGATGTIVNEPVRPVTVPPGAPTDRVINVQFNATGQSITLGYDSTGFPRNMTEMLLDVRDAAIPVGTRIRLTLQGADVASFTIGNFVVNGPALGADGYQHWTYTLSYLTGGGVNGAFDHVVIERTAPGVSGLIIDGVATTFAQSRFGAFHVAVGAVISLYGNIANGTTPATSAHIVDLYGREITRTLFVGQNPGDTTGPAVADANDDGVPEFNDGIGRIDILNGDANTAINITGGTLETPAVGSPNPDGAIALEQILTPNGIVQRFVVAPNSLGGSADFFTNTGRFGFMLDPQQPGPPPAVLGLANNAGNVIIGSPFIRDNTSPAAYLAAPRTRAATPPLNATPVNWALNPINTGDATLATLRFSDMYLENALGGIPTPILRQGIFSTTSLGNITLDAMLFGSSNFGGSTGNITIGSLYGSLAVTGDVSSVFIRGDAGAGQVRAGGIITSAPTGSQMNFGRTVGQIQIAGINNANITVLGDVNNPARPVGAFLNYSERESMPLYQVPFPGAPRTANQQAQIDASGNVQGGPLLWDGGFYRNDSIVGAEFIGSGSTGAVISGTLGASNDAAGESLTTEDAADIFAFAGGRGQTVTATVVWSGPPTQQNPTENYARIVDAQGRVLATYQFPFLQRDNAVSNNSGGTRQSATFSFTPTASGVYYLVINSLTDGVLNGTQTYTATLTGQLAVTLGMLSTGMRDQANTLRVVNGDVGLIRSGTGIALPADATGSGAFRAIPATSSGTLQDPNDQNTADTTITVGGTIHGLMFGSTVSTLNLTVGGNLDYFTTGFTAAGTEFGTLLGANITVNGDIGFFETRSHVGYQTQGTVLHPTGPSGANSVVIRAGTAQRPTTIGQLNFGGDLNGRAFVLQTSNNSVVERFDIGTNTNLGSRLPNLVGGPLGYGGGYIAIQQPTLNLGSGSDIRFASFGQLSTSFPGQGTSNDFFLTVSTTNPLLFTDDNGAQIRVQLTGVGSTARVYILPFNGPNSGPIASIFVTNLGAGGQVIVSNVSAGTSTDIGSIDFAQGVTGTHSIQIAGPGTLNVRTILAGALADVIASSPNNTIGNIVATSLNRFISVGSLGFINSRLFERDAAVESLGLSGIADTDFAPLRTTQANRAQVLEDNGAPLDLDHRGLLVTGGNVTLVSVAGRLNDVVVGGSLIQLIANSDGITPSGSFEGISGSIFATNIGIVDIGDGIAANGPSPFASSGIFALGHIGLITGGARVANPVISAPIIAAGAGAPLPGFLQGIGTIQLSSGRIDGAFIGGTSLDSWWRSARFSQIAGAQSGDAIVNTTNVNSIILTNASLMRSTLSAQAFRNIQITGGVWDANNLEASGQGAAIQGLLPGDIQSIVADSFINSTLNGEQNEFRLNQIRADRNLTNLRTTNPAAGDISDFTIRVAGENQLLMARNFNRVVTNIGTGTVSLIAYGDILGSEFNTGRITTLYSLSSIRQSTINVSGPITTLYAVGSISDSNIISDGPNGGITQLIAGQDISGSVFSSGVIQVLQAIRGDILGTVTTSDPSDGTITSVYAGRDIGATFNVARDVGSMVATRNIGRRLADGTTPDVINIRGSLTVAYAVGGTIYADYNVGGALLSTIYAGRPAFALPTNDQVSDARLVFGGRIASVIWSGDFGGQILSNSGGIGLVQVLNGSIRNLGRDANNQPINSVEARDADLTTLIVSRGHLLGSVAAPQGSIGSVIVTGDATFGSIGINPDLLPNAITGVPVSEGRFRLPPGTALTGNQDGPTIRAGRDINLIQTTGGIYETGIIAGRNVGSVIAANIDGATTPTTANESSFIVAGDAINSVSVSGLGRLAYILAGIDSLGNDNRPGGAAGNADTVSSGSIGSVRLGTATNMFITAGVSVAPPVGNGLSSIGSIIVTGVATSNQIATDGTIAAGTVVLNGAGNSVVSNLLTTDPRAFTGAAGAVTLTAAGVVINVGGTNALVTFTGPGTATYDAAARRILLDSTTAASSLTIASSGGSTSVSDLIIRSRDDASLGSLTSSIALLGATDIYIDGTVTSMAFNGGIATTGVVEAGQSIGSLSATATAAAPAIFANFASNSIASVTFTGPVSNAAAVRAGSIGPVVVTGDFAGLISATRFDLGAVRITGDLAGAVRAVGAIPSVTAASVNGGRITSGGDIGSINITGNVDSAIFSAGGDLGPDGVPSNDDILSNGNIGSVTIGGNFTRSDIAAGVLRGIGVDYIGLDSDRVADGRSTIGPVVIRGNTVGSLSGAQQFRIVANGTISPVTVGAQTNFQVAGNFSVLNYSGVPQPIQVESLRINYTGGTYVGFIRFNQSIDPATLSAPGTLTIAEFRGNELAPTFINLVAGTDYTVSYDAANNTAIITFSTAVTARALNPVTGAITPNASPGLYRFTLSAATLRAQSPTARLDGNSNSVQGDDYVADAVVGDAGDRLNSAVNNQTSSTINFYRPISLDALMNLPNNANAPTVNRPYTLRGVIGDHPNQNAAFNAGSDVDLYTINLQAGQFIRLSGTTGSATGIVRTLLNAADIPPGAINVGNAATIRAGSTAANNGLITPVTGALLAAGEVNAEEVFYVRFTGTYILAVTGSAAQLANLQAASDADPNTAVIGTDQLATDPAVTGDAIGDYQFNITVFDDVNSGFVSGTPNNNGTNVAPAPLPNTFAGATPFGAGRAVLPDDVAVQTSGGFRWTLDPGANGLFNGNGAVGAASDDIVRGQAINGDTVIERRAGTDGIFGTSDDLVSVRGSIGDPGVVGAPTSIQTDVDVYNLNNGNPITPGTRFRVTLRTGAEGRNISSVRPQVAEFAGLTNLDPVDTRGTVNLSLFDTTGATNLSNARLVAAPEANLLGGTPNTVLATSPDGRTRYGYDAQGNFYMEFTTPTRQDNTAQSGTFALAVQGVVRSAYTIDVVEIGTVNPATPAQVATQNFYIELRGGSFNWLETSGRTTTVGPADFSALGFNGLYNGLSARDYIINQVAQNLRNQFGAIAGFTANTAVGGSFGQAGTIRISTNINDFAGQSYSTIYVTSSQPPNAFNQSGRAGEAQRYDAFNANRSDSAVVWLPALNGAVTGSLRADADALATTLTGAIRTQMNSLLGVRPPASNAAGTVGLSRNNPRSAFLLGSENVSQLLQRIFFVP